MAYPEAFRRRYTGLTALKLGAQLKGELMPNNSSHLIISSTQMRLYVLRYLSMMLRNVELQTLFMLGCATQFCHNRYGDVNLSIIMYRLCKRIQHFRSTGVPKRSPRNGPDNIKKWHFSTICNFLYSIQLLQDRFPKMFKSLIFQNVLLKLWA